MAKIYKASYTTFQNNAISISVGKSKTVKVPAPPEGRLTSITVLQKSGTSVAYTVDVVDSAAQSQITVGEFSTALPSDLDIWRILPQQSANAGVHFTKYDDQLGFCFTTPDGDPTIRSRFIYLIISPTAAIDTTTWEAALTIETSYGAT